MAATNATIIHHDDFAVLSLVSTIGLVCSGINCFSITIILRSKKLRRPSNYPILSFLIASAFQALVAAPIYVFVKLEHIPSHRPKWICDAYRLPYYLCGDWMKASLLIVSIDRLIAIRNPYRYLHIITKKRMIFTLLYGWILILFVDIIPFMPFDKEPDHDGCRYIPTKVWEICVVFLFNVTPFLIITTNYIILWKIAATMALRDLKQATSVETKRKFIPASNGHTLICSPQVNINKDVTFESRELIHSNGEPTNNNKRTSIHLNAERRSIRKFSKKVKRIRYAIEIKATKTSVLLLVVYIVCWGPLGMIHLLENLCVQCFESREQLDDVRFAVKVLCFISSLLAPLVYCWRTKEFQKEVCRLFCRKGYIWRRESSQSQNNYSVSSGLSDETKSIAV